MALIRSVFDYGGVAHGSAAKSVKRKLDECAVGLLKHH